MDEILLYTTGACPYCRAAEQLLHSKGIQDISFVRIDLDPNKRSEMMARTGRRTVPQIYIGERHVGGFDDLHALNRSGELDMLLKGWVPKSPGSIRAAGKESV